MEKNNEKFWMSEHFAFGNKTPLFSSVKGLKEIAQIFEYSVQNIKQSKSPRLVILETWLVLDYMIRLFIISGLNLDKFSDTNFDIIASDFLPRSFETCLKFLQDFIKKQSKLLPNPEKNKVGFHGKFTYFVIKEHKDFYDKQFIPVLREYYKKYYPNLVDTAKTLGQLEQEKEKCTKYLFSSNVVSRRNPIFDKMGVSMYREVDDIWFNFANLFSNQWFNDVRKINNLRNISPHNIKSEVIYKSLEIDGEDEKEKLKKTKEFCIQQLLKILDIYIPRKKCKKLI